MFKRVGLFLLTNLLVIVTISIVSSILGIGSYLTPRGIDYNALILFCLMWGMGGAFISLFLSKFMAKQFMRIKIINTNEGGSLGELVRSVHHLAKKAGLKKMPEVGYYESPEVNAFATGPSRSNSLVAVSSGLLHNMDKDAVEGVLGHEVAHIANGDMVTMTLIQGIINAFVMFFARIVAYGISSFLRSDDDDGGGLGGIAYFVVVIILEICFSVLGSIVVAWFSRQREYRADAGGATLASKGKMIHALRSLKGSLDLASVGGNRGVASMKISNKSAFLSLFSTHPDLDLRIAKLAKK